MHPSAASDRNGPFAGHAATSVQDLTEARLLLRSAAEQPARLEAGLELLDQEVPLGPGLSIDLLFKDAEHRLVALFSLGLRAGDGDEDSVLGLALRTRHALEELRPLIARLYAV